jgi:molybdenum cofactor guanylyltransferase
VGAIVLAGGKSSRMGRDKALLPWAGTTLLNHVIGTVRQVTEPVVVVADVADKYDAPDGIRVVGDRYPGKGPLGGVLSGLDRTGNGYHVVVGCDMPYLQPEVLRLLMDLAEGHKAAVPCIQGRMEPLCAVYHQSCRPVFRRLLQLDELSMQDAVQAPDFHRVSEDQIRRVDPDLRSFTNLNSLEEYERSHASE